jgi:uncharacterized OB-fold protein
MSTPATGHYGLPLIPPTRAVELLPYWSATAQGRLVLPHCDACGFVIWYPRAFCPCCHGRDISWLDSAGTGTVYSHTTTRHGPGTYRGIGPYVLAYVELDEGPRVMTNLVGCSPDTVYIGQPVVAVFDPVDSECALLRFTPTSAGTAKPTNGKDDKT